MYWLKNSSFCFLLEIADNSICSRLSLKEAQQITRQQINCVITLRLATPFIMRLSRDYQVISTSRHVKSSIVFYLLISASNMAVCFVYTSRFNWSFVIYSLSDSVVLITLKKWFVYSSSTVPTSTPATVNCGRRCTLPPRAVTFICVAIWLNSEFCVLSYAAHFLLKPIPEIR